MKALRQNCADFGVEFFDVQDAAQGIVHMIGPELGATKPGMTIVCGDSHTSTHGAFGALAFGIGTSEVEHVMATQTLPQDKPKTFRINVEGDLPFGVTAKDIILDIIGRIGTDGATGYVVEYAGSAIRALSMEGRMTVCNMSIEAGARAGMIAPDETTFAYLQGPALFACRCGSGTTAVAHWRTLPTDAGATFDRELHIDAATLAPAVTWGTSPGMVTCIDSTVPSPDDALSEADRKSFCAGAGVHGSEAGHAHRGDHSRHGVSRLLHQRAALKTCAPRPSSCGAITSRPRSAPWSSPAPSWSSVRPKTKASTSFPHRRFRVARARLQHVPRHEPGHPCPRRTLRLTSNRNFEGRQGRGGRTHLVSPVMAAAAAITGHLTDVRTWEFNAHDTHALDTKQMFAARRLALMHCHQRPHQPPPHRSPSANIDTDQIIPKQFLKRIERTGYGEFLFYDWRRIQEGPDTGKPQPDFVLNKPEYAGAKILLAEKNFGCGSSREHAAWAINQFGFLAVIAPSFADIFYSNAGKNGIVLVRLDDAQVETLIARSTANSAHQITINLEHQTVTDDAGFHARFDIDPFRKHCLIHGLDDIALTLRHTEALHQYESTHNQHFWSSPKVAVK